MLQKNSFGRYIRIINILNKQPADFETIVAYLKKTAKHKRSLSKRTFQRDLDEIFLILGINIIYNYSTKKYDIIYKNNFALSEKIIDSFFICDTLQHIDKYSNYIYLNSVQQNGNEFLKQILDAMVAHKSLRIDYDNNNIETFELITFSPFYLKEFKQKWFCLGINHSDDKTIVVALDKIKSLDVLNSKTKIEDSKQLRHLFANTYGGYFGNENDKLQTIELECDNRILSHLKSLPFHKSQTIINEDKYRTTLSFTLLISDDFVKDLLSFGHQIKVLKPLSLVKKIKEELTKNLARY